MKKFTQKIYNKLGLPFFRLPTTKKDKKMEQGHIRFILMDGIGKSFIDKTVTDEELLSCIREITL